MATEKELTTVLEVLKKQRNSLHDKLADAEATLLLSVEEANRIINQLKEELETKNGVIAHLEKTNESLQNPSPAMSNTDQKISGFTPITNTNNPLSQSIIDETEIFEKSLSAKTEK